MMLSGDVEKRMIDDFISREEEVAIFLMNGFQYHGCRLVTHDNKVLVFDAQGRRHMAYKHAISTIDPE